MVKIQHFNQSSFEGNIQSLHERMQETKERPEMKEAPPREIVRETIRGLQSNAEAPSVLSGQAQEGMTRDERAERYDYLPNYIGTEREGSVRAALDRYIDMALHGDFDRAVNEAHRRLPPFMEDALHDVLTDKVLPELQKRGLN